MFPFKKPAPPADGGLSRRQALALCPVVSRDVGVDETAAGLVRLSLPVAVRPALAGLARRLGLWDGRVLRKTVELDAMGSTVWRLIDGRRTAGDIAAALAARYGLDAREAELAVAAFLRQLGRRGAVAVARGDAETGEREAGEKMPPAAGRD
ncbi:MAG: PqqD family protein [Solidesulfovibrio sp. DCME]|uniref:PqqD family protein n=1 Tax=Solidesulfovibrio sp. DCME TaxID=3447380 RepID=UPI003D0D0C0E